MSRRFRYERQYRKTDDDRDADDEVDEWPVDRTAKHLRQTEDGRDEHRERDARLTESLQEAAYPRRRRLGDDDRHQAQPHTHLDAVDETADDEQLRRIGGETDGA